MTQDNRECDVDDVLCKMQVLSNLKSLKESLGVEGFQERYPEAADLTERLTDDIVKQEAVVKESLAGCAGNTEVEEAQESDEEPSGFWPGDEAEE